MSPEKLIDRLTDRCREILGGDFVGLYVHGSYAMGCFNPEKSDIDYIIVCENEPCDAVKRCIMDATIAFERVAPAKGLEMHMMTRRDCADYSDPPKFVLHYSGAHTQAYLEDPAEYVSRMRGQDIDLWAHLMVLTQRGIAWMGPKIDEIFATVYDAAYLRGVTDDISGDFGDIMYNTLNLCRTLAYLSSGKVLSKAEGAEWALENCSSKWHSVIREALSCYRSDMAMENSADAEEFCTDASRLIHDTINNEKRSDSICCSIHG